MDRLLNKLDKIIIFFILYTIIFIVFFKTLAYTLPFVLSFIFAFLLQRPTRFLIKKFKLKTSLSALITTFIFFAIILLLLSLGITILTTEMIQLGKTSQAYVLQNTSIINNYIDILKQFYINLDPSIINAIQTNLSSSISKVSNLTATFIGNVISFLLGIITSIPYIIMVVIFTFLCTYFFTKDMTVAKTKVLTIFSIEETGKLRYIYTEVKKMLGGYFISYALIIFVTFIETLIGLSAFRVKYAVLLSILSAIFDILPILGIGSIYIPLAIIYFVSKNYYVFGGILILYAIVSIIRQVIEPKIVSSSLGIHPVPILAAIFIGLKASGISGMFFCIFLVVFYNVFRKVDIL